MKATKELILQDDRCLAFQTLDVAVNTDPIHQSSVGPLLPSSGYGEELYQLR